MTDTSIRVTDETRRRLKIYAAQYDISQDEAIQKALDEAGAPEVNDE